ncbi:DNA-binding response regulator, OmpR family, contains REC and winged-helix (wHTH) domain [Mucilaginibacter gossypiicola]|uniref:DNA-binding response regulator, OmpR family, contains REC and winged-helix (WHTH) domain n=1 Tax=Mucilaginibacter gossypiicola TaxID=551995 RepID=A0A1H8DGY1_9SPHI|nr:response regulator transcription factor [Mucilaginibacter gossypiicola]SEN06446.1 DNA-binding response regulator, OmpR family, contains REC and winged-helix (wHTH) domain [Mucilaginibacter gossypiicola]
MIYKILLLEDDYKMSNEIKIFLDSRGLLCDVVYDGKLFFKHLLIENYELYILDVNVPSLNGIEVCKKIRATDKNKPILMLTAYSDVENKIIAFESGADDYLVKPFHLEELFIRINALLRRSYHTGEDNRQTIIVDDLMIYTGEMKVTRAGKEIALTPKEYKLIELLAMENGKPVSKQTIANKVWDINFETGTNTIEVYINYLRNKIDKGFNRPLVHTRAGFGYYLK